jgi:hypothetical protein
MGRPAFDWVGKRKGMLLVLHRANEVGEKPVYRVRCDCGTEKEISSSELKGATVSCGCHRRAMLAAGNQLRHGHSRKGAKSKEYRSWLAMRNRCSDPNSGSYERYGAKGIKVCREWDASFDAFLADVGEMPKDGIRYTIDRIDASRGYEPGNCRWATMTQQVRAQTKTVLDEEKVRFIKAHPEMGPTALALKFQCSTSAIMSVRSGLTWRDIE